MMCSQHWDPLQSQAHREEFIKDSTKLSAQGFRMQGFITSGPAYLPEWSLLSFL